MGYESKFIITSHNGSLKRVVDLIHEHKQQWGKFLYIRGGDEHRVYVDSMKWYDMEADLRQVTRDNPWMLLEVERVGEEYPDFETSVFCQGRHEKIKGTVQYLGVHETLDNMSPAPWPGEKLPAIFDKLEAGQRLTKEEVELLKNSEIKEPE